MAFESLFGRLRRDQDPFALKTAKVMRPQSEEAQAMLETGLAEFVALRERCANLEKDNERMYDLCMGAKKTILKLQEDNSDLREQVEQVKARSMTYQIERDESVAKYAKLQAFLISLFAQMRAFDVPAINTQDLVQELPPMDLRVPEPAKPLPPPDRAPSMDEMIARMNGNDNVQR